MCVALRPVTGVLDILLNPVRNGSIFYWEEELWQGRVSWQMSTSVSYSLWWLWNPPLCWYWWLNVWWVCLIKFALWCGTYCTHRGCCDQTVFCLNRYFHGNEDSRREDPVWVGKRLEQPNRELRWIDRSLHNLSPWKSDDFFISFEGSYMRG